MWEKSYQRLFWTYGFVTYFEHEITENFDHMQQIEKNIKCGNVAWNVVLSHPVITCSKLAKETLEQGVKYAQS